MLEGLVDGRGGYLLPNTDVRRVLEIGCGYGDKLLLFRRLGFSIVGQEANVTRAALCRRLGIPVIEHDVAEEGELDQSGPFDLIYSTHVLEHVTNTVDHMKGFCRLLREGGYVFIEVPDFWQGEGLIRQTHGIAHCQTFTAHSLMALMRRVGLQPVRVAADTNLYVVARKLTGGEVLAGPMFSSSGDPEALLQPFAGWAQEEEGPCRITYDPARLEVERIADGKRLKTMAQNFAVRQFPSRDSLDVSVRTSGPDMQYPVRFLYDGQRPPVWVKRQ
ncbi:MAG: class I SAM-dependent methyltransferase [Rhodospirillales bacterium]